MLKEMMFRMRKHLIYIASLFLVVIAAAQTASAAPHHRTRVPQPPITVELAEKTPPADPGDPTMAGPPPTTTTTTTLPTIPRCPDSITGAATGSDSGFNYWGFDNTGICWDSGDTGGDTIYCFENPQVNLTRSDTVDWTLVNGDSYTNTFLAESYTWQEFAAVVTGAGPDYPEACFICGCYRVEGCFAPGVKIAMADGSLRNIEDVRAGDMVRNAKTGAPVKVSKVIEGPEALPLIRFGFDGATVTTSQAHPVLTAAGLKPANELKQGDTIYDARGSPHPLTILETLPLEEGQRVINVSLDAASSDANQRLIVSDGIITGDIVLQGLLKNQK